MVKTRINGKLETGKSFVSIIGRLLKKPFHKEIDRNVKMVDVQKWLLKKKT